MQDSSLKLPGVEAEATTKARTIALDRYNILDTPTEPDFDDIASLAADIFDAPIAVVNLIASGRQWFKAEIGIGARELPLDVSICAHALLQDETMVVPDARLDARLARNPLVTAEGGLRFYAGALLRTPAGVAIGTLCVLDREPRPGGITDRQRHAIEVLARQVMTLLELRREVATGDARQQAVEAEMRERQAEQAARHASDARYRSLFNSLDAGFCVIEMIYDADGLPVDYRFVEVNAAFVTQTGLDDAAGRSMRSLAPDHEQHWFDMYGKVAQTGEAVRFEDIAEALDQRWYDVHAFRVGAPGAHQVAILFNDITDRRRIELQLQQLNETLDARVQTAVAERETALDALRQSQKLEAIGQLTGGVAHDFNNLLTVIRGSVDLLRRPDLPPERRERYIDAIGDTADRAARLTGQLLAFARRQSLKPEVFDSGGSLLDVANIVRTLSGSRIVLETQVPADTCFIRADRSQFDTAIVNMCVNARDAMNGEGTLTIAAGPVSGIPALRSHAPIAGDFVAITVADSGTGIASADMDRIFEPFFTTKAVGDGTGLGLSQVIGFAKQSDGDIRVDSEVGRGTTFTLYLPRVHPDSREIAEDAEIVATVDGKGVCVLVVEDNEQVGVFATAALRELGYDSVLATDAAQALTQLKDDCSRFHIVFSDVIMPGMSGLDLATEIRDRHPDIPVILTSGYSHVLAQNGSHGFELLHKPYSVEQLSRVFRKAIAWQRRVRTAAP